MYSFARDARRDWFFSVTQTSCVLARKTFRPLVARTSEGCAVIEKECELISLLLKGHILIDKLSLCGSTMSAIGAFQARYTYFTLSYDETLHHHVDHTMEGRPHTGEDAHVC